MQMCFAEHPEHYKEFLAGDDEQEDDEEEDDDEQEGAAKDKEAKKEAEPHTHEQKADNDNK